MVKLSERLIRETHKGVDMLNYRHRPKNLQNILHASTERFPDKPVFECLSRKVSYRQFSRDVYSLAAGMQRRLHVKKGDRVALLLDNDIEFPLAFFAAATIGAVSVPINTRFVSKEIAYILKDSGARVCILNRGYKKDCLRAQKTALALEHLVVAVSPDAASESGNDWVALRDLLEDRQEEPDGVDVVEDDLASIFYTSGTMGQPKGALCTHRNFSVASLNVEMATGITASDRQLICVPLSHPLGCHSQMIAGVYLGATMIIQRRFVADETLSLLKSAKVTTVVGVPTIYWLLLAQLKLKDYDLRSLQNVIYGGAPASPELVRRLRETFPSARMGNGYGLTESSALATFLPDEYTMQKPDSVGPPVPTVQVRIVNDEGRDLPAGKIGEVLLKGPNIVAGYWQDAASTKETFQDGWLHTGDVGRLDEEGFLYIVDRKKDMIIRGGENIYCVEIENVLESHPAIFEAAVVGEPDKVFGEQVAAFVVPNPGSSLDVDEILDYCEDYLADFKVPKFIKIVENLPRNPAGIIDKRVLRRITGS
ncbi:MAG: long-chain-fatty-acid--CoA ligase [Candidatus Abyssobacteria bacterium SURF_5]|uniref:Long-chain-fatty-acid--CoA ligase n=1 Tax=Abyssobacteria bacterium (strain SURF_5) TaxID=2093360 RepID=A0A3A4NTK8_ABYX5|nr:MAG: long-chain-fatty-acid--CoA ligase [Candidatus Abyssubacteria bacterium SURF_5]